MDLKRKSRTRICLDAMNFEPVLVLVATGLGLILSASLNLLYFKICYDTMVSMGEKEPYQICLNNAKNQSKSIQDDIQRQASYYSIYTTVVSAVLALFTGSYLGAWSDKNGRKPPVLLALAFQCICYFLYLFVAVLPRQTPSYIMIIGQAISGLGGGMTIILANCMASLPDVESNPAKLTVRASIAEASLIIGIVSGTLLGGVCLQYLSFAWTLIVGIALVAVSAIYCALFVTETRFPEIDSPQKVKKSLIIEAMIEFRDRMADVVETISKQRPDNRRFFFIVGMFVFLAYFLTDIGLVGVMLLFCKHSPLFWSPSTISYFAAINRGVSVLGAVTIVALSKLYLKARDSSIICVALVFSITKCAVLAAAKSSAMVYATAVFQICTGAAYPALRVFLATLVEKNESGKIFALVAVVETMGEMIATLVYANIYAATESFYNGFVFAIAAGLGLVAFITMVILRQKTAHLSGTFSQPDDQKRLADNMETDENT